MGLVKAVKIWKCDHCGTEAQWGPEWRSKTIMHKTWDEDLIACSANCAAAITEKRETKKRGGGKRPLGFTAKALEARLRFEEAKAKAEAEAIQAAENAKLRAEIDGLRRMLSDAPKTPGETDCQLRPEQR